MKNLKPQAIAARTVFALANEVKADIYGELVVIEPGGVRPESVRKTSNSPPAAADWW